MRKVLETADEDVVRAELHKLEPTGDQDWPELAIPITDSDHLRKVRYAVYREINWKFPPHRKYKTVVDRDEGSTHLIVYRAW